MTSSVALQTWGPIRRLNAVVQSRCDAIKFATSKWMQCKTSSRRLGRSLSNLEKQTRIRQRRQRILWLETTRQLIITYYLLYTLRFTSKLYVCAVDSCIVADIQPVSTLHTTRSLPRTRLLQFCCACLVSYRMRAFRFLFYYNSNNYLLLDTVLTTRIMTLILPKSHRASLRECLNIYKVVYLHKFLLT